MSVDLSVIIISYNQFSRTTGPCLQSLAPIHDPVLEIIVVDNGSEKDTVDKLQDAARKDRRVRLLLHPENRGFAAANNHGVELSTAKYILLLNSDTLVPENVPVRFFEHLRAAAGHCLIGPVTNAAGNEQQIYITEGNDTTSILDQGADWCHHAHGSMFATDQLSFFCVAMDKAVYQQLNGLDESFGLGFYEDADFCCRAIQKRMKLQVLEDCFVYHQGSASFSRAGFSVKKLLVTNRRQFRRRHGKGGDRHVRWKNLSILQSYLQQMAEGKNRSYLFENRLQRGRRLTPKNIFKKIGYLYRLNKVAAMGRVHNPAESTNGVAP